MLCHAVMAKQLLKHFLFVSAVHGSSLSLVSSTSSIYSTVSLRSRIGVNFAHVFIFLKATILPVTYILFFTFTNFTLDSSAVKAERNFTPSSFLWALLIKIFKN